MPEKTKDWAISSRFSNREGFNDYPAREYATSLWWWKNPLSLKR